MQTRSTLDCTSRESTGRSLAAILEIPVTRLHGQCRDFDLRWFYDHNFGSPVEFASQFLGHRMPRRARPTCYFHATRLVQEPELFAEGLLPLRDVIDRVWSSMWSVARRHRTAQEWQAFRAYVEHDHPSHYAELYRTKVANPTQGGPFGFLIRDVPIYKATTGKGEWHDYLRLPEIVEDVCMAFRESFDQDLTADYLAASRPCIVKFRATGGELDAAAALLYLCHSIQDVDLAFDLGVTYDAGGARIPSITFWMWIGPSCRGRGCTQQHF